MRRSQQVLTCNTDLLFDFRWIAKVDLVGAPVDVTLNEYAANIDFPNAKNSMEN